MRFTRSLAAWAYCFAAAVIFSNRSPRSVQNFKGGSATRLVTVIVVGRFLSPTQIPGTFPLFSMQAIGAPALLAPARKKKREHHEEHQFCMQPTLGGTEVLSTRQVALPRVRHAAFDYIL
jgi:hypothetical protein